MGDELTREEIARLRKENEGYAQIAIFTAIPVFLFVVAFFVFAFFQSA